MTTRSLQRAWQVAQRDDPRWYPATVPGGIHTDLRAAGFIPDPCVGDHERTVRWAAESDWVYRRGFAVDLAVVVAAGLGLVALIVGRKK